ncbi:MAG: 50S ribosomal protein L28 [Candidatus Omnitrophica bacterium]|nr:50S ribosomal protein L28 [Candidatus Omnitrophota bacterium]
MKCEICGKSPRAGNNVSHSNKKTRRYWKPNVQKIFVEINGVKKKIKVCTQCIKSDKVHKPIKPVIVNPQ